MAKPDLIKEAKSLGVNTEGLTVPQLETAIAEAKAVLAEAPTDNAGDDANEGDAPNADKEVVKTFFEDNRGRKYAFKAKAPATLNIDGVILTQQEILEDEEIMYELILGENSFIEPIK